MKVNELENEFITGQKWAVECRIYDPSSDFLELKTEHYITGIPKKCEYINETISYIRCCYDEIYIIVTILKN